jgi:hypothetical protein
MARPGVQWIVALVAIAGCSSSPGATDGGVDAAADGGPFPFAGDPRCAAVDGGNPGEPAYLPGYPRLASASAEQDKAFYLFTLLDGDPASAAAISGDATVGTLAAQRDTAFRNAAQSCGSDVACYRTALAFSDGDGKSLGDALGAALSSSGALGPLAKNHLRAAGDWNLHLALDDGALFSAAFADAMTALGDGFESWAASLDGATLQSVTQAAAAASPKTGPPWRPLLSVVLGALVEQKRDEATRYDPLATGENQAALARLPQVDFARYPYTAILVPGQGPTDLATPLDPTGQMRCDLAADRYNAGLAPFILTSGGHVHPDQTPHCEAIEMKHYLMAQKNIPEAAILVDPYARHTTTNLRNAVREALRYGLPADRPILLTSDNVQSGYIDLPSAGFFDRCEAELFYRPWRSMTRLSPNDACFVPSALALSVSGLDLLDP